MNKDIKNITDVNNQKIDWKRKLSSRKFWITLIGFITALMYAVNIAEADVEKTVSVIMSFATLIAYVLAEGFIDANKEDNKE